MVEYASAHHLGTWSRTLSATAFPTFYCPTPALMADPRRQWSPRERHGSHSTVRGIFAYKAPLFHPSQKTQVTHCAINLQKWHWRPRKSRNSPAPTSIKRYSSKGRRERVGISRLTTHCSWAETQKDGTVPSFATRKNDPYEESRHLISPRSMSRSSY